MLKIIGVVFVLSGSVGIGWSVIRRMNARVTALRSLAVAFDALEYELDFSLPSMEDWLQRTASRASEPAASFFKTCAKRLKVREGVALLEVWREAAEKELSVLKPDDTETLALVGSVLGRYDAESQKNAISAARIRLEAQTELASEELSRCGKVYGMLSAAVGIFLVIILV